MKSTIKNMLLLGGLFVMLPLASCSDNEPDNSVTVNLVNTNLEYSSTGEWANALATDVTSIDCQGVSFSHTATASEWGTYWSGFCASRVSDVKDYTDDNAWLSHQFASMTGGGVAGTGTPYLVGYWSSLEGENPQAPSLKISMTAGTAFKIQSTYINNTTYSYYVTLKGSSFSKVFAAGDWTKASFYGVTTNGTVVGPVDYYLADYRDGKTSITKDWTLVDLSALNASGALKYVYIQMASSDSGNWGINVPAYVALDRVKLTPEA